MGGGYFQIAAKAVLLPSVDISGLQDIFVEYLQVLSFLAQSGRFFERLFLNF